MGEGDYMAVMTKTLSRSLFSWGYWFSSRTLGLLTHPYITMREITRERFLRPLVIMPVVWWILSWIVAVVIGRMGLWFGLNESLWTIPVGKGLVFGWLWGTVFLGLWQVVLGYLYVRFRKI